MVLYKNTTHIEGKYTAEGEGVDATDAELKTHFRCSPQKPDFNSTK